MIMGSNQEEDLTIVNIYELNIGEPQYIRQMIIVIKGKFDSNTIILGDFNTPLTAMDRLSRQKFKKETQALNEPLHQIGLIDTYRTIHPKATVYTFFLKAHRTFCRIDHTLGHKSRLSKSKKTEIISNIFADHEAAIRNQSINQSAINIRNQSQEKLEKNTNTWRLNNIILNNQCITEEIKEEIKHAWRQMTSKNDNPKSMECNKVVLRGKFIAIQSYINKHEKSQINNLSLHLK